MPTNIDRDEVRRLMDGDSTLIEVLPKTEYDEAHIAGAVSIPLAVLGEQAAARIPRDRPVIVYCYDRQ